MVSTMAAVPMWYSAGHQRPMDSVKNVKASSTAMLDGGLAVQVRNGGGGHGVSFGVVAAWSAAFWKLVRASSQTRWKYSRRASTPSGLSR